MPGLSILTSAPALQNKWLEVAAGVPGESAKDKGKIAAVNKSFPKVKFHPKSFSVSLFQILLQAERWAFISLQGTPIRKG